MPYSGEIQKGHDIGYKDRHNFIWVACVDCGKGHWVRYYFREGNLKPYRCWSCAAKERAKRLLVFGEANPYWKGGHTKTTDGYILIKVPPDSFFYPMANKAGYVMEHRLVMAQHLGRCLQPWEIVHHRNGVKNDNRWENLEITTKGSHSIEHMKGYRDGYQRGLVDGRNQQIKELRDEVKLLQWQVAEFIKQYQTQ